MRRRRRRLAAWRRRGARGWGSASGSGCSRMPSPATGCAATCSVGGTAPCNSCHCTVPHSPSPRAAAAKSLSQRGRAAKDDSAPCRCLQARKPALAAAAAAAAAPQLRPVAPVAASRSHLYLPTYSLKVRSAELPIVASRASLPALLYGIPSPPDATARPDSRRPPHPSRTFTRTGLPPTTRSAASGPVSTAQVAEMPCPTFRHRPTGEG